MLSEVRERCHCRLKPLLPRLCHDCVLSYFLPSPFRLSKYSFLIQGINLFQIKGDVQLFSSLKKDLGIKAGIAWDRKRNLSIIVILNQLILPASDKGRVDQQSMSGLALLNAVLKWLSSSSLYFIHNIIIEFNLYLNLYIELISEYSPKLRYKI